VAVRYENIKEALPGAKLAAHYEGLLANNKDLTNADRIYCYASTGGYALVTASGACGLNAAKSAASREDNRENRGRLTEENEICKAECSTGEPVDGRPEDNPGRDNAANGQAKGCFCNILYTFQKGNSLSELAKMFGVDLRAILSHPLNRRWKERYPLNPKPGDIVVIPQLASTTTIVSSGQSGSGYSYYTASGQTLREISKAITDAFQDSVEENAGAGISGQGTTAEAILYWNRNGLPKGVGIEDPLPAGIPLFIVSDFRKEPSRIP
jgi:hypothetical protein